MLAKRNIAKSWGAETVPHLNEGKKDLEWCMVTEKLIYEGRGWFKEWAKVWGELNRYRGTIVNMIEDEGETNRVNWPKPGG